jgi:hypothetical protein
MMLAAQAITLRNSAQLRSTSAACDHETTCCPGDMWLTNHNCVSDCEHFDITCYKNEASPVPFPVFADGVTHLSSQAPDGFFEPSCPKCMDYVKGMTIKPKTIGGVLSESDACGQCFHLTFEVIR